MFVGRNEDKSIYGLWSVQQWKGQEELPDDDKEVVAFVERKLPERTFEQKIAVIGLTVDELKAALK